MRLKLVIETALTLLLICASIFVFSIKQAECSKPPAIEWNKTYGGSNRDIAESVVEASDEGYALAGSTESSGAGGEDFWLVKVDSFGNHQWNKTYGGGQDDGAQSVVEAFDGGYTLAGYTRSFGAGGYDSWLVKVDSTGSHEWNKTYGGTGIDLAISVIETSDGGYAMAGYTNSSGAGSKDFWLVKASSSGNHQWNKTYGGGQDDIAMSLVETSDGGYILAGWTSSFGAGVTDCWLVKVDSSGNHQWNKTYGTTDDDTAWSVVETSDGGYALTGQTGRTGFYESDVWLVKVDSSGNHQWNKTYGGPEDDFGYSVIETSDGGYALSGFMAAHYLGKGDELLLVKTDSSGTMEWNITYGGIHMDYATSLIETSDKGYALPGEAWSFGAEQGDFWLVKIKGPPPVGGFEVPIDKLALLGPYIVSVALIVAVAAGSVCVGKCWLRKTIT